MNASAATELIRQTLMVTLWVSLPVLAAGFVVGIVVSLIQIVTSIQDSGFSAVPRLGAFLATLLVCLPWMLFKLMAFTTALWGDLGRYAR